MDQVKVVINKKIGGFSLSLEAVARYCELRGLQHDIRMVSDEVEGVFVNGIPFYYRSLIDRNDKHLARMVEEMGEKANTVYSELKVVEIPDGIDYIIMENDDGREYIAEKFRTWD